MSYLDQKQLSDIWRVIASRDCMKVLRGLAKNEPLQYFELRGLIKEGTQKTSITSYYIRKLVRNGFIRKDERHYFLTRVGLQTMKLIKNFEKQCTMYDLSDVDAEGKVEAIIVRNKK